MRFLDIRAAGKSIPPDITEGFRNRQWKTVIHDRFGPVFHRQWPGLESAYSPAGRLQTAVSGPSLEIHVLPVSVEPTKKSMKHTTDISIPIHEKMPVFPGDPPPVSQRPKKTGSPVPACTFPCMPEPTWMHRCTFFQAEPPLQAFRVRARLRCACGRTLL
jgi:hypothetical protein